MLKSFTAFAIFSLLGAAVIALPGFAPKVEASETIALAKGDREPILTCVKQVWPNIPASCLRSETPATRVNEARLVTIQR
jgi:hypothetical protein